jgi:hypothetical protein
MNDERFHLHWDTTATVALGDHISQIAFDLIAVDAWCIHNGLTPQRIRAEQHDE